MGEVVSNVEDLLELPLEHVREKTIKGEDMYGVIAEPILHLLLISIILCNLHCIKAVMHKLVQLPFHTHMTVFLLALTTIK